MVPSGAVIALAGNPNVGKSTLFNALTGSQQHVGNWPGKTVEKKEGSLYLDGQAVRLVDLPGAYSLTSYSSEEIITRDFLVQERPQAVIAVVDAANLERNLYLVTQILDIGLPLIVVLNMVDTARQRGLRIDRAALSRALDVPVVETVGSRSTGLDELRAMLESFVAHPVPPSIQVDYGPDVEREIALLEQRIAAEPDLNMYPARWLAISLLEQDEMITRQIATAGHYALLESAQAAMQRILAESEEEADTLIADRRYLFISGMIRHAVARPGQVVETASDRADRILTHPVWGLPIFLLVMWVVFQFTANVSAPLLDWIDAVIGGPVARSVSGLIGAVGLGGTWFEALIVDGALAGVGGVLVFVPVLLFLYIAIAVLEDSGYMARSAFVMERFMRALGLPGKSFLPMMVGFGCSVPAIYATRTLDSDDERKLTGFLTTFMSCGARLPVYVFFGVAFFGSRSGNLVFAMYMTGIVIALLTGFIMKYTVYRNKPLQPFVLELPPYRLPVPRNMARQVRERIGGFLRNASTIILVSSLVIWVLLAVPIRAGAGGFNEVGPRDSLFGRVSETLAPVFAPAGFGSWEAVGSLVTGFVAKEAIIGTISQIFVGEDAGDEEPAPSWRDDAREVIVGFGEAALLTVQEIVNIGPRTVNLLPGVKLPEADWLKKADSDDEDMTALQRTLTQRFATTAGSAARGQLAAVAFNVFVLLYVPCMAAIAAMRQEFGGRWMIAQIVYTFTLAWLAAVIVFQGGILLGIA